MLTLRGPKEPRRGSALNQLSIIPDGSLLVRDGVVVEVGATRRVENLALARQAIEVSAVGRVVMPGFVDSHTHLLFPAAGMSDSEDGVRALNAITGMRLRTRARVYLEAMARHGTTTVEVKTGCGPDESAEMKILRVLAELKQEPLDVVASLLFHLPTVDGSGEEAVRSVWRWICEEFLPRIRRRRLACFADLSGDCEDPGNAELVQYFQAARSLGLGRKMHADRASPGAAVALSVEQDVTTVDHLEHATSSDADLLGRSASIATLLPCASFHREGRFAPSRALIDAGAAVALATNFNPHHTPTLSMQVVVALACLRMGLTPAEAISASTINGAYALGRASQVGSLEPGKSADLVTLNISDYRELAHDFGANLVHMTMKRGVFIYEEGEVAPRPAEDLRPAW